MTVLLMIVAFIVGMMAGALIMYHTERDRIRQLVDNCKGCNEKLDQMLKNDDRVFVDCEMVEPGLDQVDLVEYLKGKYFSGESDEDTTNGEPDNLYV